MNAAQKGRPMRMLITGLTIALFLCILLILPAGTAAQLLAAQPGGAIQAEAAAVNFHSGHDSWDWHAPANDGQRTFLIITEPDIFVDPLSIGSTQEPDTITNHALDIQNVGTADLNWSIVEDSLPPAVDVCDTPVDLPWASVSPSSGTTSSGGTTTVDVTFDSTGLAPATYSGLLCIDSDDPDSGPGNGTERVLVELEMVVEAAPPSLSCNGTPVAFESDIPSDWSTVQWTGPVIWSTTANLAACDNGGNKTQGSGQAACADADTTNLSGTPYDTELFSNSFDPTGFDQIKLQFAAYYKDNSGADLFEVWVWDGGAGTRALQWNEDHDEIAELDLSAYKGSADVMVSFRYYGNAWDWYAQVDDVQLICAIDEPDIFVDPLFIGSTQYSDSVTMHTLDVENVGTANLDWSIVEDSTQPAATACDTAEDLPWVTVSPSTGTTAPGGTAPVDLTFDATGLAPGTYSGLLCVDSNDPDPGPGNGTDRVLVELEMVVEVAPDIAVDPLFIGSTQYSDSVTKHPLDIENVGTANLDWEIAEDNALPALGICDTPEDLPWASVSPATGTTAPGGLDSVDLTFDATGLAPGTYSGVLCVESNDPDSGPGNGTERVIVELELVVEAAPQPDILVDPLFIGSTQYSDSVTKHPLDIENVGTANLDWVIAEDNALPALGICDTPEDLPWASVAPGGGITLPGGKASVNLTFDATGLAPGTYSGVLCVESNDPDPGPGKGTERVIVELELVVEQKEPFSNYLPVVQKKPD